MKLITFRGTFHKRRSSAPSKVETPPVQRARPPRRRLYQAETGFAYSLVRFADFKYSVSSKTLPRRTYPSGFVLRKQDSIERSTPRCWNASQGGACGASILSAVGRARSIYRGAVIALCFLSEGAGGERCGGEGLTGSWIWPHPMVAAGGRWQSQWGGPFSNRNWPHRCGVSSASLGTSLVMPVALLFQ